MDKYKDNVKKNGLDRQKYENESERMKMTSHQEEKALHDRLKQMEQEHPSHHQENAVNQAAHKMAPSQEAQEKVEEKEHSVKESAKQVLHDTKELLKTTAHVAKESIKSFVHHIAHPNDEEKKSDKQEKEPIDRNNNKQ